MGSLLDSAYKATGKKVSVKAFTSSEDYFQKKWEMAQAMAHSSLIPSAYKGKPADVLMAMEVAEQMRLSLFTVTQNLDVIKGKTGWKSTFIIAMINSCGRFKDELQFEWYGNKDQDSFGCRAFTTKIDGTVLNGTWITIAMAKAEGWFNKDGSKWKTMPTQMLMYRAASFFGRVFVPDLLLGLQSSEEIIDISSTSFETVQKAEELAITSNEKNVKQLEQTIINDQKMTVKETATVPVKPDVSKNVQTTLEMTQEEIQEEEGNTFKNFSELKELVSLLGFSLTGPTKTTAVNKESFWVKAEPLDDDADVSNLLTLGFFQKDDFFVKDVTGLDGVK